MDFKNMSIWKGENNNTNQTKEYIKKNYISKKDLTKLKLKYEYYLEKAEENQEGVMKRCYKDIIDDLTILIMN